MYIIHILFSEAPTPEEQTEIQTLFGDKYASESTDTRYVYIASDGKGTAIKAVFASSIRTKLLDIIVSSSSIVAEPIVLAPVQSDQISVAEMPATNEGQKESANGE